MSAVAVIVAVVAVMTVSVYQQHIKSMQNTQKDAQKSMQNAQKTAARCILNKIKDSFSVNCYLPDSIYTKNHILSSNHVIFGTLFFDRM